VQVRTSIPSIHALSDFFNVFHFVFVVLDLYSREKDGKVFQFYFFTLSTFYKALKRSKSQICCNLWLLMCLISFAPLF
jgi:hypothetical protein